MADEVAPGLFRLAIPLPDNPLGRVNVYAFATAEGIRLVDCGWNTPEAYEALAEELESIGGGVKALREILVTHIHPDHYGLAQRLVEESGARLLMHRLDAMYVDARYEDVRDLIEQMSTWLHINGVPDTELEAMSAGSLQMLRRVGTRRPDVRLEGGEHLVWGDYHLDVLWMPGHSSGLVCLHDAGARLLLSSDHVLQRISPHVGMHTQSLANPLADYLASLHTVRDLPVDSILPGHGDPFENLAGRVDALVDHHSDRLNAMCDLLASGEMSAYDLAGRLPWKRSREGWHKLAPFERRMAVTEVVAHLEYLFSEGRIDKRRHDAIVLYRILST